VRDIVIDTANNPTTVLTAGRELEDEGRVASQLDQGTVASRLSDLTNN
jgi:hypothetical protein